MEGLLTVYKFSWGNERGLYHRVIGDLWVQVGRLAG